MKRTPGALVSLRCPQCEGEPGCPRCGGHGIVMLRLRAEEATLDDDDLRRRVAAASPPRP